MVTAGGGCTGISRAKRAGRVYGGDCGNNNSGYLKATTAAAAMSHPDCGCGAGRQRQTER